MAIAKWISFGAAQSSSPPPPPAPVHPPVVSGADAKQFGLENFGNTCYANSVLQALYFCGPFRELLEQYPDPSVPDVPAPIVVPTPAPPPPPVHVAPPSVPHHSRRKVERKFSMSETSSQTQVTLVSPPVPAALPIPPTPPTLLSALRSLFLYISRNPADRGTVAPRAFIEKLREVNELFRGSMHQDAHEFLNFLLNRIVEEMDDDRRSGLVSGNAIGNGNGHAYANDTNPSGEDLSTSITTLSSVPAPATTSSASTSHPWMYHSTFVHRLFEGVLTSETRCLTCETVSSRDESFLDLSIDIEQNSSVTACLRQFSASEMLCQKNKFFCDSCCDLQEAEKRMKIKKLPNVLALHLKRFKYQEDLGKYIKLTYRVAFPMELRLFNTVDDADDPDRLYELFAIVVHIGNGPHHGHYVTIIKAHGAWMLFDDDSVETIKESEISKYFGECNCGSAYVLYYQAVDLDMAALGIRPPPPPAPSSTDLGSPAGRTLNLTAEHSELEPGSPALPPGLTEEPEVSDSGDSPAPATPTPVAHLNSFLNTQTHPSEVPSSPLPPNPSLPVPPNAPNSPPAPTAAGPLGGLFNTLRHSQSARARPASSAENRRSLLEPPVPFLHSHPPVSMRRPATAQPIASTADKGHHAHDLPSAPGSPVTMHGVVNGLGIALGNPAHHHSHTVKDKDKDKDKDKEREKDKSPEKKASMWFKRKSSRVDFAFGGSSSERPRTADSSAWFHPSHKDAVRTADSGVFGRPQAYPLSTPSSPVSGEATPFFPRPEHKKSSPELARAKGRGTSLTGSSVLSKLPPRPSTAGATMSRSRPMSSYVPPVPALPSSPAVNGSALPAEHGSVKGKEPQRSAEDAAAAALRIHHSPLSTAPAVAPSSSTGTASTRSMSTSVADSQAPSSKHHWRRKLSLTAPMLGFGRKDREKDKDRQREKDQVPPTSFAR
ncbi:hypothetical protein SCP_0100480 [Sparassis crispa]|uniref:Ubiquitin carboxyl-terminal hydrolase n=1 Tax=Sparassis crispa TaxID=139825 RepID=A0A401G4S0_9APHY|nr:hypothetical protein SCP_0100480 [Sparassis crispa]GBE77176.1 hypothetical protein SCP_0100480 [Sparassis crispa]